MGLCVNSSEHSMLQVPEWYSCSCQELMSFRKKKRYVICSVCPISYNEGAVMP